MIARHVADTVTLNNGIEMPWFGLGVYKAQAGAEVEQAIQYALDAGYRHIDTAALYANEESVGAAIKASGIPRESIFVTTKVWNTDQGYDSTLQAFETSLRKLDMEYVDLYLVHWPIKGKYKDTWRALEQIYKDGRAKAIGVSNFNIHHLNDLMMDSEIVPSVNQVEYHPFLTQEDLHEFCKQHNIQLEAWSPLMRGDLNHPTLVELANKYGKTVAQIVLRWDLQNEVITIPKSVHQARIIENAQIFDFELSSEDMRLISSLNRNHRYGPDPDTF
ncbi:aldo/keto reductase [Alicyclobacillus acidiphilus]|uniref:aldo/keto reductase n=1 Tax=Alicyclobacillus acidiphilus TaxID=182455 RepID=UPI0008358E4B|nr:aldo/keto reductase [Alicyclobacillus acidiphilus]